MSLSRDPNGNGWVLRWWEQGSHRSRKFMLKADAEAFDRELKRRRQLGPLAVQRLTTRGGTPLGEWIETRWIPEHGATLESSTLERYASAYAVHVAPTLDRVPIDQITVSRLRAWQADLVKAGVTAGTIHKARTFLSSVLRHAAESEAIPGNPLGLVRPPKPEHRDSVRPLSPSELEAVRLSLSNPPPREINASVPGRRARRSYTLPAPGTPVTHQRDALIASLIGYAGLRPGEIRGLRFQDVRENTIRVERAADPNGRLKPTKNKQSRSVRLLAALSTDIREYREAVGRSAANELILTGESGAPWNKTDWIKWTNDRWQPACRAARLGWMPRAYDLRHSFASLLLAEGRQPLYVARQLGHSVAVLFATYAHLIDEFEESENIDAEAEITAARRSWRTSDVR
jgi:integrase